MFRLFDPRPECVVQEAEFSRLLGYPADHRLEGRALELAEATRGWYAAHGRPWIYVRQIESLDWAGGLLQLDGIKFNAPPLQEFLRTAQAHTATLVAVSAGPECEEKARQLWQESKPDEYFFLEMFGSAVVEHLTALANGQICAWADHLGMAALAHYSPGYSGWDVSEQTKLWSLILKGEGGAFPGTLETLDTGMLRPKKSLLAVVGLTRELAAVRTASRLVPCENCSLAGCRYRRKPYLQFPAQIETAARLQPLPAAGTNASSDASPALDYDGHYSLNLKALRKWSQERLKLEWHSDGSVRARFQYEGTTCSNLGRAFEFEYQLLLASRRDQYRIVEAHCGPVAGDTGHACQCEYLKDPQAFMGAIASEKPLLGRPLKEVLSWQRPYSPSGCYCDQDRRNHKWGLVFEVVHFALVQHEKEQQPFSTTGAAATLSTP